MEPIGSYVPQPYLLNVSSCFRKFHSTKITKSAPGTPRPTIYKWLFQLDDSKSLYRKWLFRQTSIYKWLALGLQTEIFKFESLKTALLGLITMDFFFKIWRRLSRLGRLGETSKFPVSTHIKYGNSMGPKGSHVLGGSLGGNEFQHFLSKAGVKTISQKKPPFFEWWQRLPGKIPLYKVYVGLIKGPYP